MSLNDVIFPHEVDLYVQSLRKTWVQELGTQRWLEQHERILKLSQQAVIEATYHREEVVKELMVTHCKLDHLVHDAFCVVVWRNKILGKFLDRTLESTFLIYSVLYHEAAAISFLEVILYHENGCEALGDAGIDLIDYCAGGITQLIGLLHGGYHDTEETDDLQKQMKDIAFQIGMKCITILSYLVDKIDNLPLGARARLVRVHDIPCIFSEILEVRPWMRRREKGFEKFINEKWTPVAGDAVLTVTKVEAQTWFCLRQLIFNPDLMASYEITDFRQRELGKLSGLLNEIILDQLPCLAELKHCLCTLQISGHSTATKTGLIMEELPEIKDKIVAEGKRYGWKQIIAEHEKIFLAAKDSELMEMAKKLSEMYGSEFFAEIEGTLCGNCRKSAEKRCAKCQVVFYCSVDCQKMDWPRHRNACKAK